MKFTKMHGCGNDYIYVNGFTEHIDADRKPELVRRLSDRHFGIGGDGVIFINSGKMPRLRWRCTMRTGRGRRCAGTESAVWQSMSMITA